MKKSEQAYKLYGNPAGDSVKDHLKLFTIPSEITEKIPVFPKRIYCNRALFPKLIEALNLIILRGL
ncbi:MAG: hypothetical protein OEL54_06410, partial [Flavobacteriaceae bacterium]|nr:hypothetical protein [Flavobacteriaceae bacterium]